MQCLQNQKFKKIGRNPTTFKFWIRIINTEPKLQFVLIIKKLTMHIEDTFSPNPINRNVCKRELPQVYMV